MRTTKPSAGLFRFVRSWGLAEGGTVEHDDVGVVEEAVLAGLARRASPKSGGHSSMPRFDVSTVAARW